MQMKVSLLLCMGWICVLQILVFLLDVYELDLCNANMSISLLVYKLDLFNANVSISLLVYELDLCKANMSMSLHVYKLNLCNANTSISLVVYELDDWRLVGRTRRSIRALPRAPSGLDQIFWNKLLYLFLFVFLCFLLQYSSHKTCSDVITKNAYHVILKCQRYN